MELGEHAMQNKIWDFRRSGETNLISQKKCLKLTKYQISCVVFWEADPYDGGKYQQGLH